MFQVKLSLVLLWGMLASLHIFAGDHSSEKPLGDVMYSWEGNFSSRDKELVMSWLNKVTRGEEETIAVYPFDLHYHIFRKENAGEPVPWASTHRITGAQGVDFYIDPAFPIQAFIEGWTASHEISHLSIPFLGRENAWFAEGFASFMQYQVMQQMGVFSAEEVEEKYALKRDVARPYHTNEKPMIEIAKSLLKSHHYPQMYWGSATYFMQLDKMLRASYGISLPQLIGIYQVRGRMHDSSLEEVVTSWDRILKSTACMELLEEYQTAPASEVFIGN